MAKFDPVRRAEIGRERRARSRARLIQAARALFAARPVDAITVEDVTTTAGAAKGAFYTHFQNLDELRAAVADDLAQELHDALEPHQASIADPLERIATGSATFIALALRDPAWGGLIARGIWAFPTVAGAARRRLNEDLQQAAAQGRLAAISHEAGFDIVVGVVVQAMRSASEKRLSAEDVPTIVAAVLRALGAPPAVATHIVQRATATARPEKRADRHKVTAAG